MILILRGGFCLQVKKLANYRSTVEYVFENGENNSTENNYFYNVAMKKKIAIIGAGPGGLTAAMILSKR